MKKYIISIILMIMLAIFIYVMYQYFFKRNVDKALQKEEVYKLPDLNDLVSFYLFLCAIVFFALLMKDTAKSFDDKASHCVQDNVSVSYIDANYEFCINSYNNIVFKNQESAMNNIQKQNETLIAELLEKRNIKESKSHDALYFSLQQYQSSESETALYHLLDIYRNYYLTEEKGGQNS